MAGMTFEEMKDRVRHGNPSPLLPSPATLSSQQFSHGSTEISPLGSLTDPLLQDVDHTSRKYLFYCKLSSPSCPVSSTNQQLL